MPKANHIVLVPKPYKVLSVSKSNQLVVVSKPSQPRLQLYDGVPVHLSLVHCKGYVFLETVLYVVLGATGHRPIRSFKYEDVLEYQTCHHQQCWSQSALYD